jgi:hypothetical protein
LREAFIKHTNLNPDAYEGQLILKDKFITQSAPDIHKKLQKSPRGPEDTLDNLLKLATKVFYSREEEELQDQKLKQTGKAETLVAALRENGFKQRKDPIYFWCNKPSHFLKECTGCPHRPCPICQGDHWRTDCPKGQKF